LLLTAACFINPMVNRRSSQGYRSRHETRLYTSSDSEYHNKTYCEFHETKCITEVRVNEITYLSSGTGQMAIDSRERQMNQKTILELFMSGLGQDPHRGTGKLFIILNIRKGEIKDIEDRFNGNILKLIRIQ